MYSKGLACNVALLLTLPSATYPVRYVKGYGIELIHGWSRGVAADAPVDCVFV